MDEERRKALLLQRDIFRKQIDREAEKRYGGLPAVVPVKEPNESSTTHAIVLPMMEDKHIETLALRAVTRFDSLSGAEAERMWQLWKVELAKNFPPLIAQEVWDKAQVIRARVAGLS